VRLVSIQQHRKGKRGEKKAMFDRLTMIVPLNDKRVQEPHEEEAPKIPWRHFGRRAIIIALPFILMLAVATISEAHCSSSGGIALVYKTIGGAFVMC